MKSHVHLEWVDQQIALQLFRKRLKAAEEKKGPEAVEGQTEDQLWDWVEMEEAVQRRGFPSIETAKGWARQFPGVDMYERPRIIVTEDSLDDPAEPVVILQLEYEGNGSWFNLDTGQVEKS